MRIRFLKILLIVSVIGLCVAAIRALPYSVRTADYKIGETRLQIPKKFLFLSPVRQSGDGVLVAFLWPEMKPRTGDTWAKFSVPGGGNVVRVLMTPKMDWDGLAEVYHAGKIWDGSLGLKSALPAKPYGFSSWTYFIAPADDEHEESYFSCMDNGRVPQCKHRIKYGDMYLSISYRKALLPDWSKIRDESFDLLKRWEVSE